MQKDNINNKENSVPGSREVVFLPLGGTGEIGMNFTLYGHDGNWLIVDMGITFGSDDFPDYPVMMADPEFIVANRDRLAGIVLTHGHEDHIGALPYLWPRLNCNIYATPFTAALIKSKLSKNRIDNATLIEFEPGSCFRAGPFEVESIIMTHSIPEPNALLIKTSAGSVLHSGDWKLDDHPGLGKRYDEQRLKSLRNEKLLALACDSTNAVVPGKSGSEKDLFKPLLAIGNKAEGRLVVTTFASNIARLVTMARIAEKLGRNFGILGPAIERIITIAKDTGYWPEDLPEIVERRMLGYLPREKILLVCSGSQGEPFSALSLLARDGHRDLLLDPGDTVIFSSRAIPGNERSISLVHHRLREHGIKIITDHDEYVHVSGHPAQNDLQRYYEWVQPAILIPIHGTPRHLTANASIAKICNVPETPVFKNGNICSLSERGARVVGSIPTGRLYVSPDGRLLKVPEDQLNKMRQAL